MNLAWETGVEKQGTETGTMKFLKGKNSSQSMPLSGLLISMMLFLKAYMFFTDFIFSSSFRVMVKLCGRFRIPAIYPSPGLLSKSNTSVYV